MTYQFVTRDMKNYDSSLGILLYVYLENRLTQIYLVCRFLITSSIQTEICTQEQFIFSQ